MEGLEEVSGLEQYDNTSPLSLEEGGPDEVDDAAGQDGGFHFTETTIIFDWDDTLLSSSWLAQNGLRLDEPAILPFEATSQLEVLQDSVIALVERAVLTGTVVIITNAETGWVELSCRKFMPRVAPCLSKVKILSARSTYEAMFPDSPSDWKVQAFYHELCIAQADKARGASPDSVTAGGLATPRRNILSFGDSIHERAAIHKVTATMGPAVRTKSIKFVERPTVEQLKRQVDLVLSCFEDICRHNGSLDLMLTIQLLYQ